jgi:hypothetical protein
MEAVVQVDALVSQLDQKVGGAVDVRAVVDVGAVMDGSNQRDAVGITQ